MITRQFLECYSFILDRYIKTTDTIKIEITFYYDITVIVVITTLKYFVINTIIIFIITNFHLKNNDSPLHFCPHFL